MKSKEFIESPTCEFEQQKIDSELIFENKQNFNTINQDSKFNSLQSIEHKNEEKSTDISDQFDWIKVIGKGTFGVVYKAKDLSKNKIVAIKKVFQDPKYSNREFDIVKELDHPNCVKVLYNFFSVDKIDPKAKYLNLVMNYIPETLYRILRFYLKKGHIFPDSLCRIYSYQLLRGIAYLHSKNICHRDIKPQNILVDIQNHHLVICDFGSAKKLKPGDSSIAYICSRYYRAPELILGEKQYSCKIDIWAIGCVLVEMYTGEPLFPGKNSKDLFMRIMKVLGNPNEEDIASMCNSVNVSLPKVEKMDLSKILKSADPDFIDLISKILVYNPHKRIDPLEALLHPFFDSLREQKISINGRPIVDLFDFSIQETRESTLLLSKLVPEWYN